MTGENETKLQGMDTFRQWLLDHGFRAWPDSFKRHNECNWYACKASTFSARECECNDGKTMQIVVHPHRFSDLQAPSGGWEGVEVDVVGEAGGVWFRLSAYSLTPDEFCARHLEIERQLIAAWNAILPPTDGAV